MRGSKLHSSRVGWKHKLVRQDPAVQWRHEVQPLVEQRLSIGSSEYIQEPIQRFASQEESVTWKLVRTFTAM
jgi:hypothetical protein